MAWHPLGWEPAAFAEIDPFACELLHYHYGCGRPMFMPDPAEPGLSAKDKKARAAAIKAVARLPETPNPGCRPNLGDLNRFQEWPDLGSVDLLVGGTPCQSFSVAGLREGLADPRGNLSLVFLGIAARYGAGRFIWENVPGVLSSDRGRAFGSIIGGMAQLGYGVAYRVLDAQYCRAHGLAGAVPQRRRRVFVIGHLGDWRRSAAVLFDGASLRGDSAPRREAGEAVAGTIGASAARRGGVAEGERGGLVPETSHTLRAEGFDASEDGTGRGTQLVPEVANPLTARMGKGVNTTADEGQTMVVQPIAFHGAQDPDVSGDVTHPLGRNQGRETSIFHRWRVRRLTPLECERLQGFPDGYTQIPRGNKPTADGPRYKGLGNSMAVNVMRVIGERIGLVASL